MTMGFSEDALWYNPDVKFIADSNVGKLARWLRIAGFDTLFFNDIDDSRLVRIALAEGRVLLTRDTEIQQRRLVTSGRLNVVLIEDDDVKAQLGQVMKRFDLAGHIRPFTRCVECNELLVPRESDEVQGLVPPYVFRTQTHYMQCPSCNRVYWRGTHWERMSRVLEDVVDSA